MGTRQHGIYLFCIIKQNKNITNVIFTSGLHLIMSKNIKSFDFLNKIHYSIAGFHMTSLKFKLQNY